MIGAKLTAHALRPAGGGVRTSGHVHQLKHQAEPPGTRRGAALRDDSGTSEVLSITREVSSAGWKLLEARSSFLSSADTPCRP